MKFKHAAFILASFVAAMFVFTRPGTAADENFPIYFQNSKVVVKAESINRTTYLPLTTIIESMGLPYTDAIALETLTVRSGNSRLVATNNSGLISLNDQIILLPSPVLRENNRWVGPVDFLTQGLSKLTGTEFRYRPGTSRIFAGGIEAPELVMNAQSLGPITRLTVRSTVPLKSEVQRQEKSNRAILTLDRGPYDALQEHLDHKDRMVRSIAYDDSDGEAKIVFDLTNEVSNIKVTPADDNRVLFVDLLREPEAKPSTPATALPAPAPAKPDVLPGERKLRVVVIDPGHGGMDTGARGASINEKDLTLTLARRLRAALQTRLGVTVLLTRDADTDLDNEARSAVANNNQANLFISLHIGYSPSKTDSGSSVFVMKENFGDVYAQTSAARDQLFLPWYLGYKTNSRSSAQIGKVFQEELTKAIPGWQFPVRTAPLAVLSSATMPSLLLEIGNLNNPVNSQTLADAGFQNRLIGAIIDSVQRFSGSQAPAAN